jgi:hypothetical protein
MPGRPTMYRDEYGVPVARQELEQVSQQEPLAASFFLARIQQIALAANCGSEASSDVYDHTVSMYCYYYHSFCMYYALVPSHQISGSNIVVLVCGHRTDLSLNQLAHDRRSKL